MFNIPKKKKLVQELEDEQFQQFQQTIKKNPNFNKQPVFSRNEANLKVETHKPRKNEEP